MSDEIDIEELGPLPDTPRKKRGSRRRAVSDKEREFKQSDEWKNHLRTIGFQKGRQKTGGRIATPKETKEWIAGKSKDVAEFMLNVMNDDTAPMRERLKAAQWLGEMSMAKAPTQQEIKVDHSYSISNLLLEAQRNAGKPIIDVTPTPPAIEDSTADA